MALPEKILNAPSLLPGLELYWRGFLDLEASRDTGFTVGPIWWRTIHEYCEALDLSPEQTEKMHDYIVAMDNIYLLHHTKKGEKSGKRSPIQS